MLQPIVPRRGSRAGGVPVRRDAGPGTGLRMAPVAAHTSSSRGRAWTAC